MFSLAMLAVALFLGVALTSSARDAANSVYFRNREKPGAPARVAAVAARAAAFFFAGLFYACMAVGVLGLTYTVVLFATFTYEAFLRG